MFDIKGKSGVYQIYNTKTNKRYIGSSLCVSRRWPQHLYLLRNGKHHSKHLQNAWDKYGEGSFVFECLEYCDPEQLLQLEHKYIIEYDSTNREFGYNVTEDVEHVAVLSKEDRKRISNAGIGRVWSEEQRQKFIKTRTGKKMPKSSETKKKQFADGTVSLIRMSQVSEQKYDEWRRHMSESRKKYFENTPDPIKVPISVQTEDDILYFQSIKSAAKYLNVSVDTVRIRAKSGTPSKKVPYIISYISVEYYKQIKNV